MAAIPTQSNPAQSNSTQSSFPKVAIALLLSMVAVGLWWIHPIHALHWQPEDLKRFITDLGMWGPVVYMGLLVVSVVISQIPGAPLAVLAGTLWPPFWAAIYTITGGFIGAAIAYALGRQLGAPLIHKLIGRPIRIDFNRSEKNIGRLLFFSRLFPVIPFDVLSYGAGISNVSWPLYASATLCGMIPSTFLLAYGATFPCSSLTSLMQAH